MTINRKPLFILIFKLLFLGMLVLFFFARIMPRYDNYYNASLVEKVERLEEIKEPKIVLLGNSNVAFGFDSAVIEERFGMPVVNMGLHGGIGNVFHEEMARLNVVPGDLYILCHTEYADEGKIDDPVMVWTTIEDHMKLWRILRAEDIYPMLKAYPIYLNKILSQWRHLEVKETYQDSVYCRAHFNEYGDVEYPRECEMMEMELTEETPEINDTCTDRINRLSDYLEKRGAKLVIAGYPVIVDGEGSSQYREEMGRFEQELREKLTCDVISDFQDYIYDRSYFYDTTYHLTDEGVTVRTGQLIEDLERYGR